MIGIVVADPNELSLQSLNIKKQTKLNQFQLFYFEVKKIKCVIILSRIGIANAAAATQLLITKIGVNHIYNYGGVGASSNLKLYDLVTPTKIFYHDVQTPWHKRGMIPNEMPFYKNNLQLAKCHNLASGSSFVNSKHYLLDLKHELDVDIFDMEAAAIAQICLQNQIPMTIIKCVSDIIGSNHSQNDINLQIQKAGAKAFQKTLEVIASKRK